MHETRVCDKNWLATWLILHGISRRSRCSTGGTLKETSEKGRKVSSRLIEYLTIGHRRHGLGLDVRR